MTGETGTPVGRRGTPWPTPGALVERGRYRLVCEVGRDDRCAALLWRGRDLVLERDVALTLFVAHSGNGAAKTQMRSAVQRALRSARLAAAGAARVLDVLEPDTKSDPALAVVVAEWTPGRDLVELVRAELPPPGVTASMLVPLAGAVDAAHRSGLVLGCDHPQRIRVSPHGQARLAFPGAPPDNTPHDDIRGLGAVLYLLLTGYWPLPGSPGGLAQPPTEPDGCLVSPRALRPGVPVELSTLALRCLAGSGAAGVHTGAAVQRVLEFNADAYDADLLPAMTEAPLDPEQAERQRRIRLGMSVVALVGATLLILGYVGTQLASVFSQNPSEPPALIVGGSSPATAAGNPAEPAAPPVPIRIEDLAVYDISDRGTPDNQEDVDLLIDGDPDTGWSTDSYREQFPAYKQGLGVMLRFEQPVAAATVIVQSPSPGTVLEVRAASEPDAELEETVLLGTATLNSGSTSIPLQPGPPTRYLLLWITTLSGEDDRNMSELSEVGVQQRAS